MNYITEVQKWIPVTERLPNPEVEVLVYTNDHRIGIDKFFGMILDRPAFAKKGINRVTHWQHLPEPPKKAIQNDEGTE